MSRQNKYIDVGRNLVRRKRVSKREWRERGRAFALKV
jgi:hypothetical protein